MPRRYRAAIVLVGVFVILGGAVGIVFALLGPGAAVRKAGSVVGAVVAVVVGLIIAEAGYAGRLPRWLEPFLGDVGGDRD